MAKRRSKRAGQGSDDGKIASPDGIFVGKETKNTHNVENPRPPRRDIAFEFSSYFGNESNLANWQRLCRDLGVTEELRSVYQCRDVSRNSPWVVLKFHFLLVTSQVSC